MAVMTEPTKPDDKDAEFIARRRRRSIALALALAAFVLIFYVLTLTKFGPALFDRPL